MSTAHKQETYVRKQYNLILNWENFLSQARQIKITTITATHRAKHKITSMFCAIMAALYYLSHLQMNILHPLWFLWFFLFVFFASTLTGQLSVRTVCCVYSVRLEGSEVSLPRNLNCFKVKLSRPFLPPKRAARSDPSSPAFKNLNFNPFKAGTGLFQAANPPYSAPAQGETSPVRRL